MPSGMLLICVHIPRNHLYRQKGRSMTLLPFGKADIRRLNRIKSLR